MRKPKRLTVCVIPFLIGLLVPTASGLINAIMTKSATVTRYYGSAFSRGLNIYGSAVVYTAMNDWGQLLSLFMQPLLLRLIVFAAIMSEKGKVQAAHALHIVALS